MSSGSCQLTAISVQCCSAVFALDQKLFRVKRAIAREGEESREYEEPKERDKHFAMECRTNVRQVFYFVGASSTGSFARAGKHTSTTLDGFIGALPNRRCPFDMMAHWNQSSYLMDRKNFRLSGICASHREDSSSMK